MRPIRKKVGRTVLGVRMGCHALRRCCLNAVSVHKMIKGEQYALLNKTKG